MSNLLGLLTVLFTGLKLADIIDWSWWLVLLPLYGGAIIEFVVIVGLVLAKGKFNGR